MIRSATAITVLLVSSGVLAAPSARPNKADKAAVIQWAQNTLADPYSMRSTGISDVTVVKGIPVVCVEFNAKNNYGGYEGIYRQAFVVRPTGLVPGSVRGSGTDTDTCYDPAVVMRPFPELGRIQ